MSALKAEAESQNLCLTGSKRFKNVVKLLLEKKNRSRICRCRSIVIGDEVAKVAVLLLADRSFKRNRLLSYTENFTNL